MKDRDMKDRMYIPLISCVMITYKRKKYVKESIKMFQKQDYKNKELIIIDDSPKRMEQLSEKNVKYYHLPQKKSIGEKRNIGVKKSKGEIIIMWDDDDIYSKDRIRHQVEDIINGKYDMSVYKDIYYYIEDEKRIKETSKRDKYILWWKGILSGSIAFKKGIWEKNKYEDINLAEDREFIKKCLKDGYKLKKLKQNKENYKYLYRRHKNNTYKFNNIILL